MSQEIVAAGLLRLFVVGFLVSLLSAPSRGGAGRALMVPASPPDGERPLLVGGVEKLTDRKVIAFMSDNHIDPDLGIESFVLEP
jgi:hypothetical protein